MAIDFDMYDTAIQIVTCLLVFVCYMVGATGNYLVCSVVYSDPAMQTVTHLILVNLAAADLIGCLLSLPIVFVLFVYQWQPEILAILGNIHWVVTSAVGFHVCACHILLSIDRYDAVIRHANPRITKERMKAIATWLWALGLVDTILTITLVATSTVLWIPAATSINSNVCTNLTTVLWMGAAVLFGTIVAVTHSFVSVKIAVAKNKQHLIQIMGQENLNTELRFTTMSVWVVLCFTVSTAPFLVLGILTCVIGDVDHSFEKVSYITTELSYAINPIIYAHFVSGLSEAMKIKFKSLFGCKEHNNIHPELPLNP